MSGAAPEGSDEESDDWEMVECSARVPWQKGGQGEEVPTTVKGSTQEEKTKKPDNSKEAWAGWAAWHVWGMVPVVGPVTHSVSSFKEKDIVGGVLNAGFAVFDMYTWGVGSALFKAEKAAAKVAEEAVARSATHTAKLTAAQIAEAAAKRVSEQAAQGVAKQTGKVAAETAAMKAAEYAAQKATAEVAKKATTVAAAKAALAGLEGRALRRAARAVTKKSSELAAAEAAKVAAEAGLRAAATKVAAEQTALAVVRTSAARAAGAAGTRAGATQAAKLAAEAAARQAAEVAAEHTAKTVAKKAVARGIAANTAGKVITSVVRVPTLADVANTAVSGTAASSKLSPEQVHGVVPVPFVGRPLADSNFLKLYLQCPKGSEDDPLTPEVITQHMIEHVQKRFMSCYAKHDGDLWAAAVRFWTSEYYTHVQASLISDNAGLLQHWVALVRLINNWVLRHPVREGAVCKRRSRMTLVQAEGVVPGRVYRTAMFTACCVGIGWDKFDHQLGGMYVRWVIEVPAGCLQCADISVCSEYPHENELLIVPYSPLLITDKTEEPTSSNDIGHVVTIYARLLTDGLAHAADHPVTLT